MTNLKLWHGVIHPIMKYFRKRRGRRLLKHFPDMGELRICDLGGSRHFWEKLDIGVPHKNITIYNINDDETQALRTENYSDIEIRKYDGMTVPVGDNFFDLLICNSVIEHIPKPERAQIAKEMTRISRRIFCQTPAYSFPIDPHFLMPFIHWLPKKWGEYLLYVSPWKILSNPSRETVDHYFLGTNLLRKRELAELFPACAIEYEYFLGFVKSYLVVSKSRCLFGSLSQDGCVGNDF